jgi:hypothetical protein
MSFATSEFVQDATCCLFSIFIFLHSHWAAGLQKVGPSIFNKVVDCGHTTNEGPVRIQYKCLIPIYVFPEMQLLFPKPNDKVLSPSFYTHKSVRDLYISRIGLPILLQGNMWIDPGNI